MAFQISEEAVTTMETLSRKIPEIVEKINQANTDVIRCYEDVRGTVGPHTQEIEAIVQELNQALKQSSETINRIPGKLDSLSKECRKILEKRPKESV